MNPIEPILKPDDEKSIQGQVGNARELPLADILDSAETLLEVWTDHDKHKQVRRLEHERAILEMQSKHNRYVLQGLFFIALVILLFCGILFFQGRDSSAMELIRFSAAVGGAVFGGYGWAAQSKSKKPTEKD